MAITDRHISIAKCRPKRVARVLDDAQVKITSDFRNRPHVDSLTIQMNRKNGGDLATTIGIQDPFQIFRPHQPSLRVDISKHHLSTYKPHRIRGRKKSHSRYNGHVIRSKA